MPVRSSFALLIVVAGLGLATSAAQAATTTDTPPPPNAAHSGKHGVGRPTAGKVVSFDAGTGALVLRPRNGANLTVYVDAQTKITVDGKAAAVADLKASERVMVTASGASDHRVAVTVMVHTAGKGKGTGA